MDKPNQPDSDRHLSVTADPETNNVTILPDVPEPRGLQQRSGSFNPASEAARSTAVTGQLLVLSPYHQVENMQVPARQSVRLQTRYIASLQDYRIAVHNGLDDTYLSGERWLLHVLLVDGDGQPVLGGRVRESELYDCIPRNRRFDLAFVRVFHVCVPIPGTISHRPISWNPSQSQQQPQRRESAAFSGLRVFRLIHANNNWVQLHNNLELALSRLVALPNEPTENNILDLLQTVDFRLLQVAELPRGLDCISTVTDRRLINLPQLADAAAVSELSNTSKLQSGEQLPESSELDQGKPLAVGVFVQSYSRSGRNLPDRHGCSVDLQNCNAIAEMLGCRNEDIHMLFSQQGTVTKKDFSNFLIDLKSEKSAKKSEISKVYLFISAHGNQEGFITSDGQTVPLPKVVMELKQIASHVTVFYQVCRGNRRHSADVDEVCTELEGFSFNSKSTAGSSLPLNVPDCSAIFASCPGYRAYSNEQGGLLLQALRNSLENFHSPVDIRQANLSNIENFCRLAENVQEKLRHLVGGRIEYEKSWSFSQIQFVMHLP